MRKLAERETCLFHAWRTPDAPQMPAIIVALAALTSALAQKLSLPNLLISDTALVFWYTEPCGDGDRAQGPGRDCQDSTRQTQCPQPSARRRLIAVGLKALDTAEQGGAAHTAGWVSGCARPCG